ncbi:hypothetical protein [Oceanobacillus jordanicus]|uniref:Permease n=1 Tax=Oceanobacillus jordanicus TaxID=2867266 RepID=A0AAW5B551_9BACI|nr:hypothetical protein [Oceanobacillus jordanicus]MCG3419536.1 hypothetical protein [Oceanobacillus jordanicus]
MKIKAYGLRIATIIYAILHFLTYFFPSDILLTVLAISGFAILLFAFLHFGLKGFKLPLMLFLIGLVVLSYANNFTLSDIYAGFLQMRDIIGLLIIVPMISWVLRVEAYMEAILSRAHHAINTSRKFYFSAMVFTQVISYFLLFGAIPMVYQFINDILKGEKGEGWENFKGTAVLRSFALSTMWVVSIPSFIFAVETMKASLWLAIIQGMVIAALGIGISVVFSIRDEKKYGLDITTVLQGKIAGILQSASSKKVSRKLVMEFLFLFVTLFGTIFALHGFFGLELMMTIPIVIFFWSLLYYAIKRRPGKFMEEAHHYTKEGMLKQSYQLSIMLGAGVLISALNQTGFGTSIVDGVYYLQQHIPFLNFLYLLPFIVILLGFLGLGPLTVMVLVAGILESIALPYPPELIVLAVTSGSVISILLSPLIMPVIVLSASNGLNGFKNGIKFNLGYAIVFYILVQCYIQTMIHVI